MTPRRPHLPLLPRAGTGSALLLASVALVLVWAWPDRPETANPAWYLVAPVRATGLAVWAWLAGLGEDGSRDPPPMRVPLARLTLGAVLSAPLEAVAFAAGAPDARLVWSLAAPLALAWTSLGIARAVALAAARIHAGWAAPLVAGAVALGLVLLDLRTGLGWWTPWALPRTASVGAGVVLGVAAALVGIWSLRTERSRGSGENAA